MQFDEALRYLLSLGHETLAIKLGLNNTELLLEELDNPQKTFPSVQIAGTNGKGSTAVVLDSICRAAGIRAGLYTSPHLVSITERIRVDGSEISKPEFAKLATTVRSASQRLLDEMRSEALPTFFEQVTAISFLAFKQEKVDLAILETGLGGRLDSTTVAQADTVAITPIALDHQTYLGETLTLIAAEKAAIIRPGVTAIVAPQPGEALEVVLRQCQACSVQASVNECAARVLSVTADGRLQVMLETPNDRYDDVLLGLRGRHQVTNVSVAIRLAESLRARGFRITREAIMAGIETADHPGRLEVREGRPRLLFDGAHNPSGARALRDFVDEFIAAPVTLVFGAMRDKNLGEMGEILFPAASRLILTQPDNPRAATVEMLERVAVGKCNPEMVALGSSTRDAVRLAKQVTSPEGLICFTGSLYLIGEVQALMPEFTRASVAG